MGTLVMYRDLPGGPKKLKFADDISRHSLCGKCHMLSMSMYKDAEEHAFCEACLLAQSLQYDEGSIYCEYERRDVDIDEMYQDVDVVTLLLDQFVDCPNKATCKATVHLKDLKTHFVTCQPVVQCLQCGDDVQCSQWETHKNSCARRDGVRAASKEDVTVRQDEREISSAPTPDPGTPTLWTEPKLDHSSAFAKSLYPHAQLQEAKTNTPGLDHYYLDVPTDTGSQQPASSQPPSLGDMRECPHCDRKVKDVNWERHLKVCPQAPVPCTYCDQVIPRANAKMHEENCLSDRETVASANDLERGGRKRNSSKRLQPSDTDANASKRRQPTSLSPSAAGNNGGRRDMDPQHDNCTKKPARNKEKQRETAEPETSSDESSPILAQQTNTNSAGQLNQTSTSTKETPTCLQDSAVLKVVRQSAQASPKEDSWRAFMRAGDYCTAFLVMEEWFKAHETEPAKKYAQFSTCLVDLKLSHLVLDFMKNPCQTHAFDCLVIATFGRVWLSQYLRARGEPVTWDCVLEYVPSVLKTRINKEARSYLDKYPVLFRKGGLTEACDVGLDAIRASLPAQLLICSSYLQTPGRENPKDPWASEKVSPFTPGAFCKYKEQQEPGAKKEMLEREECFDINSRTRDANATKSLEIEDAEKKLRDVGSPAASVVARYLPYQETVSRGDEKKKGASLLSFLRLCKMRVLQSTDNERNDTTKIAAKLSHEKMYCTRKGEEKESSTSGDIPLDQHVSRQVADPDAGNCGEQTTCETDDTAKDNAAGFSIANRCASNPISYSYSSLPYTAETSTSVASTTTRYVQNARSKLLFGMLHTNKEQFTSLPASLEPHHIDHRAGNRVPDWERTHDMDAASGKAPERVSKDDVGISISGRKFSNENEIPNIEGSPSFEQKMMELMENA